TTCTSPLARRAGPVRSRWTSEPGGSALHHTQRHQLRHPAAQPATLGRGHHFGDVLVRVGRFFGQPAPGGTADRDPLSFQAAAQVLTAYRPGGLVPAAYPPGAVAGGGKGRRPRDPYQDIRGSPHGTGHQHRLTHRAQVVRQVRVTGGQRQGGSLAVYAHVAAVVVLQLGQVVRDVVDQIQGGADLGEGPPGRLAEQLPVGPGVVGG